MDTLDSITQTAKSDSFYQRVLRGMRQLFAKTSDQQQAPLPFPQVSDDYELPNGWTPEAANFRSAESYINQHRFELHEAEEGEDDENDLDDFGSKQLEHLESGHGDYPSAEQLDAEGVDIILLGNIINELTPVIFRSMCREGLNIHLLVSDVAQYGMDLSEFSKQYQRGKHDYDKYFVGVEVEQKEVYG